MTNYNYISRNLFVSIIFLGLFALSPTGISAQVEPDGLCCDPDGTNYIFINCLQSGCCGIYGNNSCVEDPDCTNYNGSAPCLAIPISDGIPFLMIAGAFFAFYHLRDENKLLAKEV